MRRFYKSYKDQLLVLLVGAILAVLLVIITDIHVSGIDRQLKQMKSSSN